MNKKSIISLLFVLLTCLSFPSVSVAGEAEYTVERDRAITSATPVFINGYPEEELNRIEGFPFERSAVHANAKKYRLSKLDIETQYECESQNLYFDLLASKSFHMV